MKTLKVLILEGFFTGSHQRWAEDIAIHSCHEVRILSLPGRYWKWRMHGGSITLAEEFLQMDYVPDVILCTDMLDLAVFKSLTIQHTKNTRFLLYFHENQITYPWSATDPDTNLKRDNHYGFINYSSALVADKVIFNSQYHRQSFCDALTPFLNQFPDYQNLDSIDAIQSKSLVIPIGFAFQPVVKKISQHPEKHKTLLWNHRWEYDKNPELFFKSLITLHKEKLPFKLIVLGKQSSKSPAIFEIAKRELQEEIMHWGYCEDRNEYESLMNQADILPVTSYQDFFGMSVVEAIGNGIFPLLPNRLAYPEHIPDAYRAMMIYQSDEDLLPKLKKLLTESLPDVDYSWITKYDWKNVISLYDELFDVV